jgi:Domain of unknown function (DUF4365)
MTVNFRGGFRSSRSPWTGPCYFRSNDPIAFYADESHMDYWTNHALPTILILHNPDTGETIWQKNDRDTAHLTANGWRIDVLRANVLNGDSKDALIVRAFPLQRSRDASGLRPTKVSRKNSSVTKAMSASVFG